MQDELNITKFTIVTPSYKQINFLKCAAASVLDQQGNIKIEYFVHDGDSGPEFVKWAESQTGAIWVTEADDGMYDAINRGFSKAKGDIVAWLNCDEQYLPGTLDKIAKYFIENPEIDLVFGDIILVDSEMNPLAYRRSVLPSIGHIRYSHLSTFSAATFVRRKVLDNGIYLDTRWKTISDAVWIEKILSLGYKAGTLNVPLAIFSMLGSNLGQSQLLFNERAQWEKELGATSAWIKKWYILKYRFDRIKVGAYIIRRYQISVYTLKGSIRHEVTRWISGRWSVAINRVKSRRL